MTNRVDDLQKLRDAKHTEDDAVEQLSQLARAHGAESRAADIVAESVILGRYRYSPALGWLGWSMLPEGGGHWDFDDIAEPGVAEAVRQFIDQTEREYRVQAAEAEASLKQLEKTILSRATEEETEALRNDETGNTLTRLLKKYADPVERGQHTDLVKAYTDAKRQADMWLNLLSAGKISAIVRLCRGMDGVITRSTEFDAHPDLLNCRNGVVDLRTGALSRADPDLLLTHLTGGEYDPNAASDLWKKALEAVHPDCEEWFQTRVGQSATGHTPDDDVLIVAEGAGENGKSAVMSVILRALGTYARLISHRVLIAQPGQHPTELMDLRGLRFALLEETPEEGRLDTHQLKTTIGTPQITARKMRRDDVTFDTSHSLWVNTNFLPQVDTTDHGTWRRLKAMPWPFRFRKPNEPVENENDRAGDLTLKPNLKYDPDVPAAALAWIVAGAVRWYANDQVSPADPQPVEDATSAWRQNSDVGYRFAVERLVTDANCFITAEVMRSRFLMLLESEGKAAWSNQTINNRLGSSMLAANVMVTGTPKTPCKLRDGMQESRPGSDTQWSGSSFGSGPRLVPAKGKAYRVWRGIRFKTEDEMRGQGHLSMVRPKAAGGTEEPPW